MSMEEESANIEESRAAADQGVEDRAGAGKDSTEQTEELRAQIDQLKDQLLRRAAEFENFRRRTREEQNTLAAFAAEGLIMELLPVLDDLDRSLGAGRQHPDFDSFFKGMELVRTKLARVLELRGLKPLDSVGKPFDVDFHDAMLQIPSKDIPPGTIIDEIEKGYMLHDRVIRHARVTVASEAAEQSDQ